MAQSLCFRCSLDDLLLDRQCERQGFWRHTLYQKRSDHSIEVGTRNALTRRFSLFNAFVLTEVIGNDAFSPTLVIAYGHAFSTFAADDEPLYERRPFPWRRKALGSIGLTIHGQLRLISLILLPRNVPHLGIFYKSNPFGAREIGNMDLSIGCFGRTCSPEDISSCIGWLVQHTQHIMVLDFSPRNLSLMRSVTNPPRKEHLFLVKMANGRECRTGMLKAAKDLTNARLHQQIWIKNNDFVLGVA